MDCTGYVSTNCTGYFIKFMNALGYVIPLMNVLAGPDGWLEVVGCWMKGSYVGATSCHPTDR